MEPRTRSSSCARSARVAGTDPATPSPTGRSISPATTPTPWLGTAGRTCRLGVDGDGLTDLGAFYMVENAQSLAAAWTLEAASVGRHYNTRVGMEYLVDNLFVLGKPIVLPPLPVTTVAGTRGGG